MLQLREGPPEPIVIKLADGVTVTARAATAFEADLAVARTGKVLAGLIQGRDSAALAVDLLGQEFTGADFTAPGWLDAAARRIVLIDLAVTCVSAWSGIVDGAGNAIEKPTRSTLALLLRSAATAQIIEEAIRSEVNKEVAEGNGLAASPSGAAAADENTAQSATQQMPNAPLD